MKNQYFGDVNDYVKYGLLRVLSDVADLRAGVAWMLTPDDDRPDGARVAYRRDPGWREHDPELFDRLARLAGQPEARGVELFRRWDLVPGALDFDATLPESTEARAAWMERAREALRDCPLLFFDPDNGLEVASVPLGRRDATRYLYWDEAAAAWATGHSLLVYQHFGREDRGALVARIRERAERHLPGAHVSVFRSAHAAFLLAARPEHAGRLARATDVARRRWAGHVEVSGATASGDRAADLAAACEALGRDGPAAAAEELARRYPVGPPPPTERAHTELDALRVWLRDGFIDRYDGTRLVFPGTLRLLSAVLPAAFPYPPHGTADPCHPAYVSLAPTLDRVVPLAIGGADEAGNWVTTSQRNRSAKGRWTLEELGWTLRPPGSLADWDGLTAWFRDAVDARPELLEHEPVRTWAGLLERALPRG